MYNLNLCLYSLHLLFKINYTVTGFKAWVLLWQRATPIIVGWFTGLHAEKVTIIFIVYTRFTNVATGHVAHTGGLHVVNP